MTDDTRAAAERLREFFAEPMNGVVYDPYGTATMKPELVSCIRTVMDSLPEWKSIESAPKDGSWIQGYCPRRGVTKVHWDICKFGPNREPLWKADTMLSNDSQRMDQPTHWMPLPPPPAEQQKEGV